LLSRRTPRPHVFPYTTLFRSPGLDYAASRQARISRRQLWAAVARTIGYVAAALICSAWVQHVDHPWAFATRLGLVTGLVTAVGGDRKSTRLNSSHVKISYAVV